MRTQIMTKKKIPSTPSHSTEQPSKVFLLLSPCSKPFLRSKVLLRANEDMKIMSSTNSWGPKAIAGPVCPVGAALLLTLEGTEGQLGTFLAA